MKMNLYLFRVVLSTALFFSVSSFSTLLQPPPAPFGSFEALGGGTGNSVFEVAVTPKGKIYVTGTFTTESSNTVNRVMEYNGSAWVSMGTGLSDGPIALAVDHSNNVIVGGGFLFVDGVLNRYLAQWDGSSWAGYNAGVTGPVQSVKTDIAGNMVAGGSFSFADGIQVNRVTRWNTIFLSAELDDFHAVRQNRSVQLDWTTNTENGATDFDIQRSLDGINCETIGSLISEGNTTSKRAYQYEDKQPLPGINYYRLHMQSDNGSFKLLEVRSVKIDQECEIAVFPNPANEQIQIKGFSELDSNYQVFDNQGKLILQGQYTGQQI